MIFNKQPVKDFYGKIVGWIEFCDNGDKIAREFSGKIIGKYDKQFNVTRLFSGKVLYRGDNVGLLFNK